MNVTINATVSAENDLFTAVEVTDIETGERVYYSGDLELVDDEQLDAFLMGKGFELDTEAAGTWEHGIVLSGTQRGRKVTTERAVREPRDRRPARPAVIEDTEVQMTNAQRLEKAQEWLDREVEDAGEYLKQQLKDANERGGVLTFHPRSGEILGIERELVRKDLASGELEPISGPVLQELMDRHF